MVNNKPLRIKIAKHVCKICGNREQGNVLSVSREREHRNSLLICRKCIDELKEKADETFKTGFVCTKCGKEFSSNKGLLIHMSKCDKEEK